MTTQSDFIKSNLSFIGYSSKKELIENLYLKSLADSYERLNKAIATENEIRDRFMKDLYTFDSPLKGWLQAKIIYLNWENWVFMPNLKLARTDISFKISGFEFTVECKRLSSPDKEYFEEGLNRFIDLKYCKGDEFAGMIGFIIKDKNKSKNIVDDLSAKTKNYSYLNTPFSSGKLDFWNDSFLSSHERGDKSSIKIYHLFFNFFPVSPSLV